ncbi:recombination protein NinB [Xenorhabdus bovienii]|uniref:recombination protein NinB n=1 Tax=Xenorhabdus bovienii TaxID=40576 RepID=UPI0023B2F194|nr:recombination protein NinB [Xenorhabdus bovienii]MDE9443975.1 recombination protein NinB [Xenorhabdus bovienii]
MTAKTYYLSNKSIQQNAIEAIRNLPLDPKKPYEIKLSEPKRTNAQNRKMWATLGDIAKQVQWDGEWYDSEDWKDLITVLNKQTKGEAQRSARGLGGGIVFFGMRTSKMKVGEIAEVIECAHWFGTDKGVVFSDDAKQELEWAQRFGDKLKRRQEQ